MLWMIIGALIGIAFIVLDNYGYKFQRKNVKTKEVIINSIKALGAGAIGAIIGFIAWMVLGTLIVFIFSPTIHLEIKEESPIYGVNDSKSREASFFLGTGGTYDSIKYYYFKEFNGAYILSESRASNTYIIYIADGEQPHVERYGKTWGYWFIWPWVYSDNYQIYVPEGTIQVDYRIDLQ